MDIVITLDQNRNDDDVNEKYIDPNDPDDVPDFLDDYDDGFSGNNKGIEDTEEQERELYRMQQEKVNDELDNRKGRPWKDPYEIKEEQWMASDTSSDNLPDWSPSFVSRISLERLQVLPTDDKEGGGIPTLEHLVELSLPSPDPVLHPSRHTKSYAAYRKRRHFSDVRDCVERLARGRVEAMLANNKSNDNADDDAAWMDKQDAVDRLFEDLQKEAEADGAMDILSKHPEFPKWVDRGLEEHLREAQQAALLAGSSTAEPTNGNTDGDDKGTTEAKPEAAGTGGDKETAADAAVENDESDAVVVWKDETPIFMDCYDPSGADTGPMVPKILSPLEPHRHGGPGKMVEEWELSAHSTTKRIMLRDCTKQIAKTLLGDPSAEEATPPPRIYVHGTEGVGKSAVLASIVASARTSGYIVMYLPDGDRLRKNGFFITPSTHPNRQGMFDLQDLSQEALKQLVESPNAAEQMKGMIADRTTMETYFKDTQLKRVDEYRSSNGSSDKDDGSMSLIELIEYAQEHKKQAPMCYSVVVNILMHQTTSKFMIVMDEFNCLFDHGQYFHMAYDETVRDAIPCDKINLFEPIMAAMNLTTKTVEEEEDDDYDDEASANATSAAAIPTAALVVATTESHSIRSSITEALTDCAKRRSDNGVCTIEVPRFSSLEADHVLANFEATGVGKLRLDRGDTLMNPQEVEFLKMASGSVGQKLLDVSIF